MKKQLKEAPANNGDQPLPQVNVEYATSEDAGKMTSEKMRSLMCNPIYAGVGSFPALVDDETWVRTAAQMIEKRVRSSSWGLGSTCYASRWEQTSVSQKVTQSEHEPRYFMLAHHS